MKHRILFALLIAVLLVSGCSPRPAAGETQPAAAKAADTATPQAQPSATETPLPTATNTPEPTATPTATPQPEVIDANLAAKLSKTGQWGAGAIKHLNWSPDNQKLALLTSTSLQLFDAAGKQLWSVDMEQVQELVTFIDDQRLATISPTHAVQLWDVQSGKALEMPLKAGKNSYLQAISANGQVLANTIHNNDVFLWETTSGKPLAENLKTSLDLALLQIELSADGSRLMVAGVNTNYVFQIQLWDTASKKFLRGMKQFPWSLNYLHFSQDGKYIGGVGKEMAAQPDQTIFYLWDTSDGRRVSMLDIGEKITAFSLTGKLLLATESGGITERDMTSGNELGLFEGNSEKIILMQASPDGKLLASASDAGTLVLWDITGRKQIAEIKTGSSLYTGWRFRPLNALSTDGEKIAQSSSDWKSIRLLETRSGKEIKVFTPELTKGKDPIVVYAPALSPDGKLLAAVVNPNRIIVWDIESGKEELNFESMHHSAIRQMLFSRDGQKLITLAKAEMYSWNVEDGKMIEDYSGFSSFDLSPDGTALASDNVDYGVYLWDFVSGKQLSSLATEYVNDLSYSPDGKLIAVGGFEVRNNVKQHNPIAYLIDTKDYKNLPVRMVDFLNEPVTVLFSPDSKLLAVGEFGGTVSLWDVAEGVQLATFTGAADGMPELFFSPDGRTLLVGGKDGVVRLYEARR